MLLKRITIAIFLMVGFLVLIPRVASAQEHNCDFAAVLTMNGYIVPDIPQINDPPGPFDDPNDFFLQFIIDRAAHNDDGYGIIYAKDGEMQIPGSQKWYSPIPYHFEPFHLLAGSNAVMNPANDAVMVMAHDRHAYTGNATGNHPFTFEWNGKTYAFMHNGVISAAVKNAMWNELYNWYGSGNGQWFQSFPSNWAQNPAVVDDFIDSELLFHWIMKHIMSNNGSTFSGIRSALAGTIRVDPPPTSRCFSLYNTFINNCMENVINFVLFDGESLYVYRNSPAYGGPHEPFLNISYRQFPSGFVGVKTWLNISGGNQVPQYTLVHIARDAAPVEFSNFLDRQFGELQVTMTDSPDPVSDGQYLTYNIVVTNNGPYAVDNVILQDNIPSVVTNPYYSTLLSPFSQSWNGSVNLGTIAAYTSTTVTITGQVDFGQMIPRAITNTASLTLLSSSIFNADPEPRNNSVTVTTSTLNSISIDDTKKK